MAISMPRSYTKYVLIVALVLLAATSGAAIYFYKQYTDLKNSPNVVAQQTTQRLVSEVGKLYDLPKDETPTVAQVSDKEKVKDQPFFKNVENGDWVLVYQTARMAVLYRESQNKLINVGPISLDQTPQSNATTKK
jgi:hypothetical protein